VFSREKLIFLRIGQIYRRLVHFQIFDKKNLDAKPLPVAGFHSLYTFSYNNEKINIAETLACIAFPHIGKEFALSKALLTKGFKP